MGRAGRLLSIIFCAGLAVLAAVFLAHAVITSASNKVILAGNGATTVFSFPFVGVAAADLSVIYTDASGNQTTLVQGTGPTQYQVSLNAPAQGSLWGIGGTVTYNPSGTPIASGTSLTIARTLPYTQSVSLQNQASYGQFAKSTEQALDLVEMQIQQVVESGNRTIQIPIVDPAGIVTTLPAAAQRANQALVFDGSGNVTAGVVPSSGTISSAMAPVVSAVSIPAGRTALGLGTTALTNVPSGSGNCGQSLQANGTSIDPIVPAVVDTVSQTVTCGFHLNRRIANATINYSLPRANTLFNGFGFWIEALGGNVAVFPNAADIIQAQTVTSGAAIFVPQGGQVFVATDGSSTWYLEWGLNNVAPITGGSFANLKITVASLTATITADELVLPNTANYGGAQRVTAASFQCILSNSGANGLDTGVVAGSTWYAVYAIGNGGNTYAGLCSLSGTSPTMPTGYTFRKRLGWVLTNGPGNALVSTIQSGRDVQYTAPPGMVAIAGAFWTAQAVGAFVPTTASRIKVVLNADISAVNQAGAIGVAPNNAYAAFPNVAVPCGLYHDNNFGANHTRIIQGTICDLVLESTNIYVGKSGAATMTGTVSALGWTDNL